MGSVAGGGRWTLPFPSCSVPMLRLVRPGNAWAALVRHSGVMHWKVRLSVMLEPGWPAGAEGKTRNACLYTC